MQSQVSTDNRTARDEDGSSCPNCGALMPRDMRFCRACGCRLGEGIEEYTETVRLKDGPHTDKTRRPQTASRVSSATSPRDFGEMARDSRRRAIESMTSGLGRWKVGRACKRVPRWMIWVIVPIFVASLIGGPASITRRRSAASSSAASSAAHSYIGSEYKTVDGGAFVEDVSPPGSAADLAGLIGGDVITSVDGKRITSESDLSNLLSATPVGKTVEVVYTRDGETKTTKLTTVSEAENDRLAEAFDSRPQGKGFLGVDDKMDRVQIPGTNLYGVRLDDVRENRPAYLAGLQNGDIVIEFDKVPIRTEGELNKRIDRALPRSTVKVVVMRGSERLEVMVTMGKE
jgi:membrane-associated protease RseP (regulator of RpoE activity)